MTRPCRQCGNPFEPKAWQIAQYHWDCAECRRARPRTDRRSGRKPRGPEYRKALRDTIAASLAGRVEAQEPKPTPKPKRAPKPKPAPKTTSQERFHPTNPAAAALWREVLRGRA